MLAVVECLVAVDGLGHVDIGTASAARLSIMQRGKVCIIGITHTL
jgi:hypothetical protein